VVLREAFGKFFADRGTHLAAMVAYFALLSFVPLTFLALVLLSLGGQPDETNYVVTQLEKALPRTPVTRIINAVEEIRDNARTLGIVGGVLLAWSSLSLFSVLESALNIVYGRPNRSFLRGKALAIALLVGSLVTLFVGLLAGSFGYEVMKDLAPGFLGEPHVAYTLSVLASMLSIFVFLVAIYYLLTNERLTLREVLPGAVIATVALEVSFQGLPIFIAVSDRATTLHAVGGPVFLLIWLYVMANVIIFGAEVNYCLARRRVDRLEESPGLA
jgi:membrane protein